MPTTSSSRAMRRWIRPPSRRCPLPARSTSKVRAPTCACRCARFRKATRRRRSARKRIRRWPSTTPRDRTPILPRPSISARGWRRLRSAWIAERDDTVELSGPTSTFGQARLADPELAGLRFDLHRKPRRARPGANVTQMHYARRGIVTPEMEFVAIRENQLRETHDRAIAGKRAPPASGARASAPRSRR